MRTFSLIALFTIGFLRITGQEIAIRNANVIDVKSGSLLTNYGVVINGDTISWIGPDQQIEVHDQTIVVDGTGKYLLPGLIDAHIHFFQSGSLYTRPDAVDLSRYVSYEEERQRGFENTTDYLRRYLRLGITTVMDVGGPFSNFVIRDSIRHTTPSPNVLVTGPLFSIVARQKLELNDPPIIQITSQSDAEALFNKMLPSKPDFIKIWYIAGEAYPAEESFPLVKHIGSLCAEHNLKLAVHATSLKTARLAVEAGASILVHSIDDAIIPDDFIATLKERQITYIPTMLVSGNYAKVFSGKLPHHPQDLKWANAFAYGTLTDLEAMDTTSLPLRVKWLRKQEKPWESPADSFMKINLKKLVMRGVNVATGTDAGNIGTFHASSYQPELEAMQEAGLSNAEILRSSTLHAASGFGLGNRLGSIEVGKIADLILVQKNPLESIQHLNLIDLIFKDGIMFNPDTLVTESPEAVVQRQLNAYNARNIDLFLATYHYDVEIYNAGFELTMKGHQQLKTNYEAFFKKTPNLYCKIEQRIVINNKVIDKELIRVGNNYINAAAIYEVERGKIKRVTFVR